MSLSVVAVMMMVLGTSPSARARDMQVETVSASGAEWPELNEAVARALLVGGARVVMRGPTTGACEYCVQIKVVETRPGFFRIEAKDPDGLSSTTLALSSESRLLDRARAIAIHARLLVGRPNSEGKAARSTRKPQVKTATAPAPESPPTALVPAEPDQPARVADDGPMVNPAPSSPMEGKARAEATRPERETKAAEQKEAAAGRPNPDRAPARTGIVASPTTKPPEALWPWMATALGAGAAIGAGVCALVARQKYDDLSDRTQSMAKARSLKSSGENWQTAAFVLSGVAAAGLGVGIVGFASRSTSHARLNAAISPIPSGGMAWLAWGLP